MLRKQPTFCDATCTGFPAKWRMKKRANKFHTDDASVPRCPWLLCCWVVENWSFCRKTVVASQHFGCFLRLLCEQGLLWYVSKVFLINLNLNLLNAGWNLVFVSKWYNGCVLRLALKIETKIIPKDTFYFRFRWRNRREAKKKKKANERTSQGR